MNNEFGLILPEKGVPRRISKHFTVVGRQTLAKICGPGCIRRFWVTGKNIGRELTLRIYFDNEAIPYVEAPLSDFFGVMHNLSESKNHDSSREPYLMNTPYLALKPHNGFTCYFPMPFARNARIEIENETGYSSELYYIVEWHDYLDRELKETARFSARWRREAPVRDYQDEFLILDATGPGRFIGFVYSVDMIHNRHLMRWSHAGSDNIYVDGETSHPSFLRGIGGEDTFGTSYGGHLYTPQSALFSDMPFYMQKDPEQDTRQKMVGYRFFIWDSICFEESLHVRFGARAHDIAATAYWYASAPVRPFAELPPYNERLPSRRPGRKWDLELPDRGHWWICGPFPSEAGEEAQFVQFEPRRLINGRMWRRRRSNRGFLDFNHVFRPKPSNENSATLVDVFAIARCEIEVPHAGPVTFDFGWDDHLAFSLNGGEVRDLGDHPYFQSKSTSVFLDKGKNHLSVRLTNTTGLSSGGWCFSFRAVTAGGLRLVPRAEWYEPMENGSLLDISFGAQTCDLPCGFMPFVPPYFEDPNACRIDSAIDLIASPQTETYYTSIGPVSVSVSVSDNTSLGFRDWDSLEGAPHTDTPTFLRSEVRANRHPDGEQVSLIVRIDGLAAGRYNITSVHHTYNDKEALLPANVSVNTGPLAEGVVRQTWGIDPGLVGEIDLDVEGGMPVSICYTSLSAVVLNGLSILRR